MILEVNSFPKIFDSRVNQAYPPQKILWPPHRGGKGGWGHLWSAPPISHFIGGSESLKIWGVRGIIIMWQLVFASCHRLKSNNKKKKNKNKNKGRNGTSHGHPVSYFLPIPADSSNLELFVFFLDISCNPLKICIGPTIRIGREIRCLPYAGFLLIFSLTE